MTDRFADVRARLAEGYLLKDDGDIPIPGGFRDGAQARRDVKTLLTDLDRQATLLEEARELMEAVRQVIDDSTGDSDPDFEDDWTDEEIKAEDPLCWAHIQLVKFLSRLQEGETADEHSALKKLTTYAMLGAMFTESLPQKGDGNE
jgi:hypothetical protein